MVLNLFKGMAYTLRGFNIIRQPGIRRFIAIPLAINIILFSIGIYYLVTLFEQLMDYLMPDFPEWLSWLETFIESLLWPMFAVMIFFVVFYTFSFVANLIAAPFNSLLAEKVETLLRGEPLNNTSLMPAWKTITKSLASELGKLLYLIKWSILILIISFIPVINIVAPALWLIFGAWMLALEYLDYPMGNHGHHFREINQQAVADKTLSLGLGSGVFILTSIPFLNFLAMPASVAGATALWIQKGNN